VSPRQNRVLPTGEIVADPARGLFTGNRGCLHDDQGRIGRARWRHPHWITCALDYKGWRRQLMQPGRWTELFFLDEAVALAAGHRPCALCRRAAYDAWRRAWAAAGLPGRKADEMDRVLHAARVGRDRQQILHQDDALPTGAFVALSDPHLVPDPNLLPDPHLVVGGHLFPYTPGGYGAPVPRPDGALTVLTPVPTMAVLRAGFQPVLHPSAAG
jgi:hypothetical protein